MRSHRPDSPTPLTSCGALARPSSIVARAGTRRVLGMLLGLGALAPFSGCSPFQLASYDSFGDWYIGKAGINNALDTRQRQFRPGDVIQEPRPVIFGHFRLFEVLWQPVGGVHYPDRVTSVTPYWRDDDSGLEEDGTFAARRRKSRRRERGDADGRMAFDMIDGGVIDMIPYRLLASEATGPEKAVGSLLQPVIILFQVALDVFRVPVYAVHDVSKILVIPVAAFYY